MGARVSTSTVNATAESPTSSSSSSSSSSTPSSGSRSGLPLARSPSINRNENLTSMNEFRTDLETARLSALNLGHPFHPFGRLPSSRFPPRMGSVSEASNATTTAPAAAMTVSASSSTPTVSSSVASTSLPSSSVATSAASSSSPGPSSFPNDDHSMAFRFFSEYFNMPVTGSMINCLPRYEPAEGASSQPQSTISLDDNFEDSLMAFRRNIYCRNNISNRIYENFDDSVLNNIFKGNINEVRLPNNILSYSGIKCPLCNKVFQTYDFKYHLITCLSKPGLSYNEDILVTSKGECVICLEDLIVGDMIARLPCLCIYHKKCIEQWFRRSRSCPEHPDIDQTTSSN